jgi:predicted ABC-type ATPase
MKRIVIIAGSNGAGETTFAIAHAQGGRANGTLEIMLPLCIAEAFAV